MKKILSLLLALTLSCVALIGCDNLMVKSDSSQSLCSCMTASSSKESSESSLDESTESSSEEESSISYRHADRNDIVILDVSRQDNNCIVKFYAKNTIENCVICFELCYKIGNDTMCGPAYSFYFGTLEEDDIQEFYFAYHEYEDENYIGQEMTSLGIVSVSGKVYLD